jgi:hypothetical protein
MAQQITLSDEDYAALVAAATRAGASIEDVLHRAIAEQLQATRHARQAGSYQMPTGEPDSPEDEAEDEELARLFGPERPWLSDIIIEDRGPR